MGNWVTILWWTLVPWQLTDQPTNRLLNMLWAKHAVSANQVFVLPLVEQRDWLNESTKWCTGGLSLWAASRETVNKLVKHRLYDLKTRPNWNYQYVVKLVADASWKTNLGKLALYIYRINRHISLSKFDPVSSEVRPACQQSAVTRLNSLSLHVTRYCCKHDASDNIAPPHPIMC